MQQTTRNLLLALLPCFCLFLFLPSCRVVKNLPEGQTLLVKNKFVLKNKLGRAEKEKLLQDMGKITAQKPNVRFLQILPFRMWLYYSATHGKKLNKFKQWIIDKVGEAPVVYDSTQRVKSITNIENYLWNYGYFDRSVSDTVTPKKRRTKVIYNVQTNQQWKLGSIELPNGHNICASIVREHRKNTFLKKGVATLSAGYADGYPRHLSNREAAMLVRGQRCPLLGRVTMDLMVIDVSHVPDAAVNDEVVLMGRQGEDEISATDLAVLAGTINWEIVTRVGSRVRRVYV